MTFDVCLRGGRTFDVFSGRFRRVDVGVADGRIAGFGTERARRTVDLEDAYLIPGLIDAHVHIESSQLVPESFACAVAVRGTTTVIADPHEIANVLGLEGIRYVLRATDAGPVRVFLMAPSCVPASPFETSGARLGAAEVAELLSWDRVLGLGEVMNYPGVVAGDPDVHAKLAAAAGRPIDGHAPGLSGAGLAAYVAAGPSTDHECTSLAEAEEKLAAGMHILIREGSTARNLLALLPLLTDRSAPFVHFCTDDRDAATILREGHIDDIVRRAIAAGLPPERVIAAATIHAARAYRLPNLGAIAPGYAADFVVLSDLDRFKIRDVYVAGRRIERDTLPDLAASADGAPTPTMHVLLREAPFRIAAREGAVRVLEARPHEIVTGSLRLVPRIVDGEVVSDPERDVLKIAVVERHSGSGRVGLGLVRGFGFRSGAIASTVAHDSHNLVAVGASDDDLLVAVRRLVELGGGQVVVRDGELLAELALPIAGLMSSRPIEDVARQEEELETAAHGLGCRLPAPFMTLSFLALPVIPHLKLTDRGLIDVDRFEPVSLYVD